MKPLAIFLTLVSTSASHAQTQPNIIIINADDLGYGDLSCNGMTHTLTPNIDRVAAAGIRLTNAHSTSATSTPSRYSLLTGNYAWRVPGTGVAPGDAGLIIRPEVSTLPDMLHRAGYTTAAVGKWHLGIGDKQGAQDWNGTITPALDSIGFDYSFIMAATADRVPCVYIEQGQVVDLDPADPIQVSYKAPFADEPTGKNNPELLRIHPSHGHDQAIVDSISRIGYMRGGKSALWKDELIADRITDKALNFIRSNADAPFFLYFATNDVHVPRVPHWRFKGKSGMGDRGDAILEFDHSVGQILHILDSLKIADNTLLIITSDNGPVVDDGYLDRAAELLGDHRPSGNMRGGKYGIYKGGTCIPFIARWANVIPKGATTAAALSQIDLFATLAYITNTPLTSNEAPDSENHIEVLRGYDKKGRQQLVTDAYTRSITVGQWKYIVPSNGMKVAWETGNETGNDSEPQLYNIGRDPSEKDNLATKHPKKVLELAEILKNVENRK